MKKSEEKLPLENDIQAELVKYLDDEYPDVVYNFNWLAGAKLSPGLSAKAKRLGQKKDYPDLFIAVARGRFHGLFLELKRDKTRLKKKNGEWAREHFETQNTILEKLKKEGYFAEFSIGYEETQMFIDSYLGISELADMHVNDSLGMI